MLYVDMVTNVTIDKKEFKALEDKDAALIMSIQELTKSIDYLRVAILSRK